MKPAAARSWPRSLSEAQGAAAAGRYDEADRQLAGFARSYPRTEEAAECLFWRALFRMDPSNPKSSPREAVELLDRYLESPAPRAHEVDARVLRRTVAVLDERSKAVATFEARNKERDEELQQARDELAKSNAELERIKRRLVTPKP